MSIRLTTDELRLIGLIADRATKLGLRWSVVRNDLVATHSRACRLRLDALLACSDEQFQADIEGIEASLDRHHGRLRNSFRPQCRVMRDAIGLSFQAEGARA